MPYSKIIKISTTIATNTKTVDDNMHDNTLPTPSFDVSYPPAAPLSSNYEGKARCTGNTDELEALLRGPMSKIFNELVVKGIFQYTTETHLQTQGWPQYTSLAKQVFISLPNST